MAHKLKGNVGFVIKKRDPYNKIEFPEMEVEGITDIEELELDCDVEYGNVLRISILEPEVDVKIDKFHIFTKNIPGNYRKSIHVIDEESDVEYTDIQRLRIKNGELELTWGTKTSEYNGIKK